MLCRSQMHVLRHCFKGIEDLVDLLEPSGPWMSGKHVNMLHCLLFSAFVMNYC